MKKLNKNAGFTLAELLIVVAIIAVLVAIAIPVFAGRLEQSRETTDISNLRSAYAAAQVAALSGIGDSKVADLNGKTYYFNPDSPEGLVAQDATSEEGEGEEGSTAGDKGNVTGQGTDTDGHANVENLPKLVTYSKKDVRGKHIVVTFGAEGLESVKFDGDSASTEEDDDD